MPTPAYTDLDSNNPLGSQSPTGYSVSDLANIRALRDMALNGRAAGFAQSRSGSDITRPQYIYWIHPVLGIGFRLEITWNGYQPSTVQWSWTNDNSASWTAMGSAQVNTFSTGDSITASTNSGGFFTLVLEVWAKALRVVADLATHIGLTGTGVHGLGSISTQAANNVAISGGSINNTAVGNTTPAAADVTRLRENFVDLGAIVNGGTATLDLVNYAHFSVTPHSTTTSTMTIAVSGPPASGKSQTWTLEIINGQRSADAKITWPASFKWVGGSAARPVDTSLELSGRNIFVLQTRDGGTRYEIQHIGKGG